jgi:hypothetical protein
MCSVKRLTLAAFGVALLALVLAATPAPAQRFQVAPPPTMPVHMHFPGTGGTLNPYNYYDPYGSSRQAAFNIALYGRAMSQVPPYALGYNPYPQIVNTPYYPTQPYYSPGYGGIVNNPAAYTSPGYSSPGYGGFDSGYSTPYQPYYDPTAGFLYGSAAVMNADGKFRINNQQANLMREQVRSAHIENNRKAFDEFLYERANRPTWLDDLERQRKLDLRYALSNPSASEILQGISLNTLLDSLRQMQAKGGEGTPIPLTDDLLSQINVTAGGGVNPGLLKADKLTWPLGLSGQDLAEDRKKIERNLATAISEVEHGQLEAGRLKDLSEAVDKLSEGLNAQVNDLTPSQYIEARNYVRLLNDAVRTLGRPDAAKYINNQYAAKGKTVGDLVRNMSGLRFAPATPGAERAYRELYDKLVAYYHKAQPSQRGE